MAGFTTFFSGGGGGPDLTLGNSSGILYIQGSEFVDGSIRLIIPSDDSITTIQKREDGVWNSTDFELNPASLHLGLGFTLSAASGHLILSQNVLNANGQGDPDDLAMKQIVIGENFDDAGSTPPRSTILSPRVNRIVVQPDESLELTLAIHFSLAIVSITAFSHAIYFKTGSVGATAPVTFRTTRGVPPDDVLFFEREFPASTFSANTEVRVEVDSGVGFVVGTQLNQRMTSDNPFSILYNAAATRFWTAVDAQAFALEDLLSFPTGFDRLLMSNDGNHIASDTGNFIMREAA